MAHYLGELTHSDFDARHLRVLRRLAAVERPWVLLFGSPINTAP